MNSVHDMGGMHGMGPIQYEKNEPVFHEPCEARIFALNRAMSAWRKWSTDTSRHAVERIPAPEYLRMSYYEQRLHSLVDLMIKSGLVTRAGRGAALTDITWGLTRLSCAPPRVAMAPFRATRAGR
jgi:nitrile hydratase subunit beta